MYNLTKICDCCGSEMKIKASLYEQHKDSYKSPTKEWNLSSAISGLHICEKCALIIDNSLLRFKLEVLSNA